MRRVTKIIFVVWCASWPFAVAAMLSLGEPIHSAAPTARWADLAMIAGPIDVAVFYVGGGVWLARRVLERSRQGSSMGCVLAACGSFLYLSPFGPVSLVAAKRILDGPSHA